MKSKYNIGEKKERTANYISAMKPETVDRIYEQIMLKFVVEKKYRDSAYTAAQMAKEILYTGFSSRQSFYAAFFRMNSMTPMEYRVSMTENKDKKK